MHKSTITIEVETDDQKIPAGISWSATDTGAENAQKAKAMMIAFWDSAEKAALRIDLWTKDMMVDEMADFYYQFFMTMADNYKRATHDEQAVNDIKQFAKLVMQKFRKQQEDKNKPQ